MAKRPTNPAPKAVGKHPIGDRAPHVEITTRAGWRAWLAANHAISGPIWLVYPKRSRSGDPANGLGYDDIVEEALCFGWIDSLPRGLSESQSMIYVSPRRPRSVWSALNKRRISSLQSRGLMQAAGQAVIDAAIADRSWTTLDAAENLEMPADLAAAFDADPVARENYNAFPPGAKKLLLTWVTTAKRAETRLARIAKSVALAHDNIRASAATRSAS